MRARTTPARSDASAASDATSSTAPSTGGAYDFEAGPPHVAMRGYRLARVQRELRRAGCAAAVLLDPINIRYATGSRNMSVWLLHNLGRYCFVPASGTATLYEFPSANCMPLARGLETIGEIRPARGHSTFLAGEHVAAVAREWARELADQVRALAGAGACLAIDRCDAPGLLALQAEGLALADGQQLLERARAIKCAEELDCMRESLRVAETGVQAMRAAMRPGATEVAVWAELHRVNVAAGGEWIETRLLSSGPRTNPWYQEASHRALAAGDLVGFDTDLIGPHGYCADISRTYRVGDGAPTPRQATLYSLAYEQVRHNCEVLRPGLSFAELRERAWRIPEAFREQHYGMIAHGVGMADEWPCIGTDPAEPYAQQGVLEPGMTLCIESYVGEVGGHEGVKLEEQVLITEHGWELLSARPLDERLPAG